MKAETVVYMADEDDRFFMRQSFQKINPSVRIVEAEDGQDLLTLLVAWSQEATPRPVHLILLDMNMPRLNGLETLKALKANPLLRHIPTVLLSTSAEPTLMAAAYQTGSSGYIKKSFSGAYIDEITRAVSVCYLDAATD